MINVPPMQQLTAAPAQRATNDVRRARRRHWKRSSHFCYSEPPFLLRIDFHIFPFRDPHGGRTEFYRLLSLALRFSSSWTGLLSPVLLPVTSLVIYWSLSGNVLVTCSLSICLSISFFFNRVLLFHLLELSRHYARPLFKKIQQIIAFHWFWFPWPRPPWKGNPDEKNAIDF